MSDAVQKHPVAQFIVATVGSRRSVSTDAQARRYRKNVRRWNKAHPDSPAGA